MHRCSTVGNNGSTLTASCFLPMITDISLTREAALMIILQTSLVLAQLASASLHQAPESYPCQPADICFDDALADADGISSAYFLPQEFIDNSIMAFLKAQEAYKAEDKPLPTSPQILLLYCFPDGRDAHAVNHSLSSIMVLDNACGMNWEQLAFRFMVIGKDQVTAWVRSQLF
jgi:hypothetical protein